MCIQHFSEDSIIKESSFVDSAGSLIKIPLSHYKFKEGAVPTIFSGCPGYMTKAIIHKETREEKLKNTETRNLSLAIQNSIKSNEEYESKHFFSDFEGLKY